MKHVLNILLLGMVLLGIVMTADTPWGLAVALAPFIFWGARFLVFIHKSIWATVVFWGTVTYFQWKISAVAAVFFGLVWLIFKIVKKIKDPEFRKKCNNQKRYNKTESHDSSSDPFSEYFYITSVSYSDDYDND